MTRLESPFSAVQISERAWWVGAVDWGIRDFHGYATQRGSTYNAYLVRGEKIALIDTAKAPFREEMLARIASVVDPARIDYIVCNHAEMDHSGSLPHVLPVVKPQKVFASALGAKALPEHFGLSQTLTPVKEGEPLDLGGATLHFVEARMLHWPDNMLTYLAEDRALFSNDGFGMHLASSRRFADEIEPSILEYEAAKYYANILLPLSTLVTKLLAKVGGLNLAIDLIAPSHGPIWRHGVGRVIDWYGRWANGEPKRKAVVVYDTMWESTGAMARAIGEGLSAEDVETKIMPLRASHRSDVATELLDAAALVVGSPTLNNGLFPTMADVMTYLKGLKPRNLVGAAFGSYGWSGEAVALLEAALRALGAELASEGLKAKYVPDRSVLAACRGLGETVAARVSA